MIAALARGIGELGQGAFIAGFLAGIAGWIVGTAIIWLIRVVILRITSDFRELLRTLGFASVLDVSTGYALSICLLAALPNLFMVFLLSLLLYSMFWGA